MCNPWVHNIVHAIAKTKLHAATHPIQTLPTLFFYAVAAIRRLLVK